MHEFEGTCLKFDAIMHSIGERSFYCLKGFPENRTIRLDNPDFQSARFTGRLLMNFIFQVTPQKETWRSWNRYSRWGWETTIPSNPTAEKYNTQCRLKFQNHLRIILHIKQGARRLGVQSMHACNLQQIK